MKEIDVDKFQTHHVEDRRKSEVESCFLRSLYGYTSYIAQNKKKRKITDDLDTCTLDRYADQNCVSVHILDWIHEGLKTDKLYSSIVFFHRTSISCVSMSCLSISMEILKECGDICRYLFSNPRKQPIAARLFS